MGKVSHIYPSFGIKTPFPLVPIEQGTRKPLQHPQNTLYLRREDKDGIFKLKADMEAKLGAYYAKTWPYQVNFICPQGGNWCCKMYAIREDIIDPVD